MVLPGAAFDALADLLTYPGHVGWVPQREAMARLRELCPATGEALAIYEARVGPLGDGEREELFTRTFDNTNERSLEIGWQLFGENYARGALMVRLRGLLREHGVPETSELPDHLTHVLRLLGRAPTALSVALIRGQVLQAIEKVLDGCRAVDSPYIGVLEGVRVALEDHAGSAPEVMAR